MNKHKISMLLGTVILLLGICFAIPTTTYAAKETAKKKDLNIHMQDGVEPQGTDWLFTGTLVWNPVKNCSDYEIYRSCDGGDRICIATTTDGVCQYTDSDLEYSKKYRYTIYACKKSNGTLVKKYYSQKEFVIGVSPVSRPNISSDEVVTNPGKIEVILTIVDDTYVIKPDYIEINRTDKSNANEKKMKVAWADLNKAVDSENADTKCVIYTDSKVKAGRKYEYSFCPYRVINGEKVYCSTAYTDYFYSYNSTPACDVEIETQAKKKTMVMKLQSHEGNAMIVINNNEYMSQLLALYAPKSSSSDNFKMKLSEISYDGKTWIPAKKSLHIMLKEMETIYLKFAIEGEGKLNVTGKKTEFSFSFRYMYDLEKPIKDSRIINAVCTGNLTNKKFSNVVFQ